MVLCNPISYVFARAYGERGRTPLLRLEFSYRLMRSGIPVKRELLGEAPFFDRRLHALFGGGQVAAFAQEKSQFCQML